MKCPHCQWQNAASFTHCFNCHAPLHAPPPVAAPAPDSAAPDSLGRVVAALLDLVMLGLLLFASVLLGTGLLWGVLGAWKPEGLSIPLLALAILAFVALLPLLVLAAQDGRRGTFGKRNFDLRVLHTPRHGPPRPPGLLLASLRQVLRFGLHLGLPFVFALIDRLLLGPQGLHNLLTRCRVVRASASDAAVQQYLQHEREHPARPLLLRALGTAVGLLVLAVLALNIAAAVREGLRKHQTPDTTPSPMSQPLPADMKQAASQAVFTLNAER